MIRNFGLHTFCCLLKKGLLQDWDLQGQEPVQNHGDEILHNEGLIAKKTVHLSSAMSSGTVVLRFYSYWLWA